MRAMSQDSDTSRGRSSLSRLCRAATNAPAMARGNAATRGSVTEDGHGVKPNFDF